MKIIVAIDTNGSIGANNDLLYYIKEDLQNFKEVTLNKTVVMGYNTWLSLPKRPLPNRRNVVLYDGTEDLGVETISSIEELIQLDKEVNGELFVMGGASVYNQLINQNLIDEAHITLVYDKAENADVFIEIDKLKQHLPTPEYKKTFIQDNLIAFYIILSR